MNERQIVNKIIHNFVEVNEYEDYTNYKGMITALIEWKNEALTLTDVVKSFYCCKEVIGLKVQCNNQCKQCNKFVKDNF